MRRNRSASKPPKKRTDLAIREIVVQSESRNKLSIKTNVSHGLKIAETTALIDCGAEGRFVHESAVEMKHAKKLRYPLKAKNVDGSENKKGKITHQIMLHYDVQGVKMKDYFFITDIGDQKIILGIPWLKRCNPQINWKDMSFTLDHIPPTEEELLDQDHGTELLIQYIEGVRIRAKTSATQHFEHKFRKEEEKAELPEEYKEWKYIFNKTASQRFPSSRPWDHEIKLKEGFIPKVAKPFPLAPKEQILLDEWIKEQTD